MVLSQTSANHCPLLTLPQDASQLLLCSEDTQPQATVLCSRLVGPPAPCHQHEHMPPLIPILDGTVKLSAPVTALLHDASGSEQLMRYLGAESNSFVRLKYIHRYNSTLWGLYFPFPYVYLCLAAKKRNSWHLYW